MRDLTTEEFKNEIYDYDNDKWNLEKGPVLLDLWAPWCGPCKTTGPILEEIDSERDDIGIYGVNVDDEPELADAFGIQSIPTFILIDEDRNLKSFTGALPKEKFNEIIDSEAFSG